MFTGLVEQKAQIIKQDPVEAGCRLTIRAEIEDIKMGESIAVNGVCLTVLPESTQEQLVFDVSPETLKKTALSQLCADDYVNLERAMMANGRFGGHYVSGHVDTSIRVKKINPVGDFIEMVVGEFLPSEQPYLLSKGSITLDGVSLTINEVSNQCIHVLLIPETIARTTLSDRRVGQYLNVEFDYLTRIVAHQLELYNGTCAMPRNH